MSTASPTLVLDRSTPSAQWQTRLAVAFAVVLLAFWPTWASFPQAWIERGEHGFVAAAFCGWLAWRDRRTLMGTGRGVGIASVLVAGLSTLWLVAIILNARVVHQAALPLLLLAWLLATAGMAAFRAALPIVGAFFLAVPLWGLLIGPLQFMTVVANRAMLSLTGIQVKFDGNLIAIPAGVFEVAEGCAGINFFEVGVLVGVMHALLFLRTWKARGMAVLVAAVLAIVSNWLRVFGLILIGHFTEMQSPLIQSHGTYGWLIFAAVLFTFFFAARYIEAGDERLAAQQAAANAAVKAPATHAAAPGRETSLQGLMLPTGAALIGPVALFVSMGMPPSGLPSEQTPGISPGAEWAVASPSAATGAVPDSGAAKPWSPAYRGADEHRVTIWTDTVAGAPPAVQVDRLFYRDQSQGKELINSENRIARPADKAGEGFVGPLDDRGRRANVTAVRTPSGARLVWSWFNVGGVNSHYGYEAKLLELVAFVARSPASELIAVSTPCAPDDCEEASRTLYRFVVGKEQPAAP